MVRFRESSLETSRLCVKCIQQDVQYQSKIVKLNERCFRQQSKIIKLEAEVRMLRRWAKMLKLSPPSLINTPPSKNAPTSKQNESIVSKPPAPKMKQSIIYANYEYSTDEANVQHEEKEDGTQTKDGTHVNDVMTPVDISDQFADLLDIGEPMKRKRLIFIRFFVCVCITTYYRCQFT